MKKYWVGVDTTTGKIIVCTTKSLLANFFSVSAKTIDRWILIGNCTKGRHIFRESITKVKKDGSSNLGAYKSSWKKREKPHTL